MSATQGIEFAREIGKGYRAKALKQQAFGLLHGIVQCRVYDPFNRTLWVVMVGTYSEDLWPTDSVVNVQQTDLVESTRQHPATVVTLLGSYVASLAQPCQSTTHHYGIGAEHRGDLLGGHGPGVAGHMQQHMKHAREAAIGSQGSSCCRVARAAP